ncbi:MAG TPA: DUF1707 domain-containing protein [Amycolatopsis sp.]|uniref:DUF1707 SHOCT-like domain-containing protein n=1 Tax=Amycolatopsis sp. TaxID=37632 RepID=UPI002B46571E|nr:DUF1707 domain-containing protein [Amycolatopsis sp.]HKS49790.1 DUF1707 domain-containing protein [Amycolatopsis sp.]
MESDSPDIRIGDTEREDAIGKLGEHMTAGRLGVDEYGERTARVAAAKTRRDLLALFTDLPEPHPAFGTVGAPPPAKPAPRQARQPARPGEKSLAQRIGGAMVPLSALLAVVLFFGVFHVWYVFLLPAAAGVIVGSIWGDDRHQRDHRHRGHRRLGSGD